MKTPMLVLFLFLFYWCHSAELFNSTIRKKRGVDWCSLRCKDGKEENIGCTYKGKCDVDSPCELATMDPNGLLDMHNKLRHELANGDAKQAAGFKVSNMMALNWDNELAFLAKCNLKPCRDHFQHDKCHNTPKFKRGGQNLAWSSGMPCDPNAQNNFVQGWYDEIEALNADSIKVLATKYDSAAGGGKVIGHFTQLVWAKTSHVGCAVVAKGKTCTLACNYGPAGNMLGDSAFKEGAVAGECPESQKPNEKYKALCGTVKKAELAEPEGSGSVFFSGIEMFYLLFFNLVLFLL